MGSRKKGNRDVDVIPLIGRDEMNLVEFPFGPATAVGEKTFEVEHPVFDRQLKREVNRKLLITGSDAFGLPKPIDDQVLIGMKALTYEAKFASRRVEFSRYHLCRAIGWGTDGRAYRRLEESFDRIAGTTLKFKDSWYDKGDQEWKSKTFHLIEEVELCSRDRLDRARQKSGRTSQHLCSFVWNETIWKSFDDGFLKKLDMEMFRKVSSGRRKEIPLRLYRILDKRFYNTPVVRFDLRRLCSGTLGLSRSYCPSEMARVLKRAADWLIECGYLSEMQIRPCEKRGKPEAVFYKMARGVLSAAPRRKERSPQKRSSHVLSEFQALPEEKQNRLLEQALSHCRESHPHLAEGFERNRSGNAESAAGYLEMVIAQFLKDRKAFKAV